MAAELVKNEFGAAEPAGVSGGMLAVAQQREIAEVQSKMIIAQRFPRNEKMALDRILQACTRLKLAESALYSYSRGGTDITGPSIRLAETIAQNWGNIDFGIRELEQKNGESTVEAYAWDVQTNTSQRKIFQVPHIRYSRTKGNTVLTDPRDIYELVANQGARRLRACILGVIPGDVVESAAQQCELTLRTRVSITPELLQSLLEKFAAYGVAKEQIEARIQRRFDAITPALVVQLGKIYNSIKDGMSKPSEWFTPEQAAQGNNHGTVNLDDLKPGSENRGHGNENLNAAAKPKNQEAKPEAETPEPLPDITKPKASTKSVNKPTPSAQPANGLSPEDEDDASRQTGLPPCGLISGLSSGFRWPLCPPQARIPYTRTAGPWPREPCPAPRFPCPWPSVP